MPLISSPSHAAVNPIRTVVTALKDRFPWQWTRSILKQQNLHAGIGWDDLISRAEESTSEATKLSAGIRKLHLDAILGGRRTVRLYDLGHDDATAIAQALAIATIATSDFSAMYPCPLPTTQMAASSYGPSLVEIRDLGNNDFALVFCSIRAYDVRETYAFKQLGLVVQQAFKNVDEIITVTKQYFQAFDVIFFRSSLDRVEVCIDQPSRGEYASINGFFNALITTCLNIHIGFGNAFQKHPRNLFPAVNGIYRAPKEGIIRSLGFRTLTGLINRERMIVSTDDLRSETFHDGGARAVRNEILPFEIVVWFVFVIQKGFAEVSLLAPVKEVSVPNGQLFSCEVGGWNEISFVQAINKIVKYLP